MKNRKVSENEMKKLKGGFKPEFSISEGAVNGEASSYIYENCVPHPYNAQYCKMPLPLLTVQCQLPE